MPGSLQTRPDACRRMHGRLHVCLAADYVASESRRHLNGPSNGRDRPAQGAAAAAGGCKALRLCSNKGCAAGSKALHVAADRGGRPLSDAQLRTLQCMHCKWLHQGMACLGHVLGAEQLYANRVLTIKRSMMCQRALCGVEVAT